MSFWKNFRTSSRKSDKNNVGGLIQIQPGKGIVKNRNTNGYHLNSTQDDGIHRSNTFTLNDDSSTQTKASNHSTGSNIFSKLSTLGRKKNHVQQRSLDNVRFSREGSVRRSKVNNNESKSSTDYHSKPVVKLITKQDIVHQSHPMVTKNTPKVVEPQNLQTEDNDQDKFKTVTLNSFRKSFRERFLASQKDAPYNPAWFVEIEPAPKAKDENLKRDQTSPVRNIREYESPPKVSIKRNETFRVDSENTKPSSIRVDSINSSTMRKPIRNAPLVETKPYSLRYPEHLNGLENGSPSQKSTTNVTTIKISSSSSQPVSLRRDSKQASNNNFERNQTTNGSTNNFTKKGLNHSNYATSAYRPTSYDILKNMYGSSISSPLKEPSNYRSITLIESKPQKDFKNTSGPAASALTQNKQKLKTTYVSPTSSSALKAAHKISHVRWSPRHPVAPVPWR